jgi:hypothetical protein
LRYALAMCGMLALSAKIAVPQSAPAAPVSSDEARKASVILALDAGVKVRVTTTGAAHLNGRFRRIENDSLVLYSREGDAPGIPLIQIGSLFVHARSHAKGLVYGALVGGALGGAGIGLLAISLTRSTGDRCNCDKTIEGTLAVSALIGGAIGAAVGWPIWRRVWPR